MADNGTYQEQDDVETRIAEAVRTWDLRAVPRIAADLDVPITAIHMDYAHSGSYGALWLRAALRDG